jgi:F-type H+-transporting ATPase subunit epsilon
MRVSLTTPRGSLVDMDVDEVIAPGVLGEFGILPGHVPFLSGLRPGVLVLRTKQEDRLFAIGDGLLEVVRGEGERVLVLVDQAAPAEEIDRAAATKEVADADAELGDWKKEVGGEYRALQTRRAYAAARAEAASRSAPH